MQGIWVKTEYSLKRFCRLSLCIKYIDTHVCVCICVCTVEYLALKWVQKVVKVTATMPEEILSVGVCGITHCIFQERNYGHGQTNPLY